MLLGTVTCKISLHWLPPVSLINDFSHDYKLVPITRLVTDGYQNTVISGATYFLERTISVVPWGMFADKYGRKPCIVISILSVIVFNTLFGLSTTYWMAIVTRGLFGLLCGILGPIKAYASEVCRKEHQAQGISLVTSSRVIALVVGPAIGGFLAQAVSSVTPHNLQLGWTSQPLKINLSVQSITILVVATGYIQVGSMNRCLPLNTAYPLKMPFSYGSSYGSFGSHGSYTGNAGLASSYGSIGDRSIRFQFFPPTSKPIQTLRSPGSKLSWTKKPADIYKCGSELKLFISTF